jgi:alkanesulfonate monooxygenase SsuD/methylene tetrahydromethanopterin reductase-like flavin-dependent oxidoreductase (luciferase family)
MRYGISLPNAGECDARAAGELAHIAEAAGWDAIFLEDYIVYQGVAGMPTHDPWVMLAAMALRTERILLGTTVTPLARRRPWKVAREAVTLDHFSNGRLILGVGSGVSEEQSFAAFGEEADARTRGEMLDEGLAILDGLWSGQSFSFAGKHYSIGEVTFLPVPLQRPRIPIWVGGGWPKPGPMRRAAKWDGVIPYKHSDTWTWEDLTPDEIRAMKASIERERASSVPSAPFDIAVGGRSRRDDLEVERDWIRSVAEAGATWWTESVSTVPLEQMRARVSAGPIRIE